MGNYDLVTSKKNGKYGRKAIANKTAEGKPMCIT